MTLFLIAVISVLLENTFIPGNTVYRPGTRGSSKSLGTGWDQVVGAPKVRLL